VSGDIECVCLPMEFAPCSACARDRASCDQCFWVKEARRQATIEREAEAALDAANRSRDIPDIRATMTVTHNGITHPIGPIEWMSLDGNEVTMGRPEYDRLQRIEASARGVLRGIGNVRRADPDKRAHDYCPRCRVNFDALVDLREALEAK